MCSRRKKHRLRGLIASGTLVLKSAAYKFGCGFSKFVESSCGFVMFAEVHVPLLISRVFPRAFEWDKSALLVHGAGYRCKFVQKKTGLFSRTRARNEKRS